MTTVYKIPRSVLVVIHTPDLQVLMMERAGWQGFW
jgi:dATP pyrophosphohydrolase